MAFLFTSLLPDDLHLSRPKCTGRESTLAGTRSLVLDNGLFSLSILPEYGGRLCSLYYRPLSLELLATEFITGPRNELSVRGGWCAAFPSLLADGELLSHLAWEGEIAEVDADHVTARLWVAVDRVSHKIEGRVRVTPGTIVVERFVRLVAGEAAVTVEDVLTNRNIWPMPTTWAGVISLRAKAGDVAIFPVGAVEVQQGVGPFGNELDFGLLVSTPYQAMARDLREGWVGFRPGGAPIDVRLTFPKTYLPHTVVMAQRDDAHPAEDAFRFMPIATAAPVADDTRGGALVLPPRKPLSLPIRLEVGTGMITSGEWSRPGLQLAELIVNQRVPVGRVALWRVGEIAIALKTHRHLALLLPEWSDTSLLTPEDLPAADLILCADVPTRALLRQLAQRTAARFVGTPALRQRLLEEGFAEERSVALSPGARFDLPGLGILATPARSEKPGERLGFLIAADHIALYHAGPTEFLGEFGPIGQQFHPPLVFLPLHDMTITDALHAARQLQPRVVVPLGPLGAEQEFDARARDQHVSFAIRPLHEAEGVMFDGYKLAPLDREE